MYFVLIILYEYFRVLERIIWVSIISYGEIHFDIRVLWITSAFPEWITLPNQGTTVRARAQQMCIYETSSLWKCPEQEKYNTLGRKIVKWVFSFKYLLNLHLVMSSYL
jgi:hypothetical protein